MDAGAQAHYEEGMKRLAAGELAAAETSLRAALELAPEHVAALGNLALVLDRRGATGAAELCYARVLALAPDNPELLRNYGTHLLERKQFADAESAFRCAIEAAPEAAAGWSNLGVLLACRKREEEAEQCYRHAMQLDPHYRRACFNLSYLLLRQGRWEEGWTCLEARDWHDALEAAIQASQPVPRWQGESLAGKALLIGCEAGHGDMIQLCRYVTVLKAHGARRIVMLCHAPLKALFASLAGLDGVVTLGEPLPAAANDSFDYWVPAFSIPHLLGTRPTTIPAQLPYLHAAPERIARWQAALPAAGRLRVGLVWKGNPRFENDADRSLPLSVLAPLAGISGVSFVSLQKGAGEDEAAHPPPGLALVDIGSRLGDFADAAAVVAQLDLVISVDTAMAHLAGALGRPCWLLLPDYRTDWRWLTARSDTPWYPGVMRLFRQPAMGEWGSVVVEVAGALRKLVGEHAG